MFRQNNDGIWCQNIWTQVLTLPFPELGSLLSHSVFLIMMEKIISTSGTILRFMGNKIDINFEKWGRG